MTKIDLLNMMKKFAVDYRESANTSIKRNNHMNNATGAEIAQEDVDALLVDFINYVGVKQGVDYALYASDLKST